MTSRSTSDAAGDGSPGAGAPGSPTSSEAYGDPPGDPVEVARRIVVNQLSHAPRTRAQLEAACLRRGVPVEAAQAVLDRFGEVGLVDDDAFAQAWVESRHAGRRLGRRALTQELRRRGVAEPTVEQAVAQVDDDAERAAAESLVRHRLPTLRRYDRRTQVRRLHGLLVRRGYSSGLALTVVREVLAEQGLDDTDDGGGSSGPGLDGLDSV